MLKGLFGPDTLSHMLRGGLEEASATHRAIGERVASAMNASSHVDFPTELGQRVGRPSEADLERDMAALADTQLRYEAEARLLQAAYGQLRTAIRTRG
jgi:flagellar basal body rod protein FlgB